MTTEPPSTTTSPRLDHLAHELDRFRAFVRSRVPDRQQADDVLHDAFARAAHAIDQVRDDERLDAWFYRILRNRIADLGQGRAVAPAPGDLAGPDPDEAAACRCFAPLIDRLSAEQSDAIRSVDLQGLSPDRAAETLGITVNSLNVRRHRGRQQLRRLLEMACGLCATEGCRDCACEPAQEMPAPDDR